MSTDQDLLLKACFELSAEILREDKALSADQVEAHMQELNEMTTAFVNRAECMLFLLEGLEDARSILVSAILYLKDSQALSVGRDNSEREWFQHSLLTLLTLIDPVSPIRKSNLVFIQYIHNGLWKLAREAKDDEDIDQFSQT